MTSYLELLAQHGVTTEPERDPVIVQAALAVIAKKSTLSELAELAGRMANEKLHPEDMQELRAAWNQRLRELSSGC